MLITGKGALQERLRLGVTALELIQASQIVGAGERIRMIAAQHPFPCLQGTAIERFGLGIEALFPIERCQITEAGHRRGMLGT